VFFVDNLQFFSYSVTYPAVGMSPLLPECYGTIDNPEARCIKERSSDLRQRARSKFSWITKKRRMWTVTEKRE